MRSTVGLALWLVVCLGVGALGGMAEPGSWYADLQKPSWAPPSWVFAPVWTALYALMAVAAWRIWLPQGFGGAPKAMLLFGAQLLSNGLWSALFFGMQSPGLALIDLSLLWVLVLLTTFAFFARDRLAGALLIPYLLWTSFAWALNFSFWQLNT